MEGIDQEQRNVEELATRIEELNAELKALEKARKDSEAQETAKETLAWAERVKKARSKTTNVLRARKEAKRRRHLGYQRNHVYKK
tara:strand:- start:242 stop:496 length:255 start_codon:yes stop_codon:yes gene_type:complete